MPLKTVKRGEFKIAGDEVTHEPTGKWFRAYPGMANIAQENSVDVDDYQEYEIRQMAETLLAQSLKKINQVTHCSIGP
jgi:hypothetical protein